VPHHIVRVVLVRRADDEPAAGLGEVAEHPAEELRLPIVRHVGDDHAVGIVERSGGTPVQRIPNEEAASPGGQAPCRRLHELIRDIQSVEQHAKE